MSASRRRISLGGAMRPRSSVAALGAVALAALGWTSVVAPSTAGAAGAAAAAPTKHAVHVCSQAPAGFAACNAMRVDGAAPAAVSPNALPAGLGPADLVSAYKLPAAG